MSNVLGKVFTITSFGESHGNCVGVVIDGCPSGLPITVAEIQQEVDKRRPVAGTFATARAERDKVEILSGIFNDRTTGAPLCLLVRNRDMDSSSYAKMESLLRPGHADYSAYMKYGGFSDYRGGGRFSGRITAGFVMAGAVAKKLLRHIGVDVVAHTLEIGGIKAEPRAFSEIQENAVKSPLRCADAVAAEEMLKVIEQARTAKDSVGGVVEGIAMNVPAGLGEPVFDNLDGEMAKALFAIPAVKGVEFGVGFAVANLLGSDNNDSFIVKEGRIETLTNNAGGVLGGISNGMPLVVRVAVKPTPSIEQAQETVDIKKLQLAPLEIEGRHDTCIVPRAVPVVEAMMAVTLCDFALRAEMLPRVLK